MMFQPLNAKVEAPNYDFSLDALNDFLPEKKISELTAKHGKGEQMNSINGMKTYKFQVAHIRYKFPVLVQEKGGIIQDFFARLPSYFLHDIFLNSLVKKLGKQTSFTKVKEEAIYIWNTEDAKHVYSAACTITCFPIFYAVQKKEMKSTLLDQMKKASE